MLSDIRIISSVFLSKMTNGRTSVFSVRCLNRFENIYIYIYIYTADDYMNIILEEIKDFIEV